MFDKKTSNSFIIDQYRSSYSKSFSILFSFITFQISIPEKGNVVELLQQQSYSQHRSKVCCRTVTGERNERSGKNQKTSRMVIEDGQNLEVCCRNVEDLEKGQRILYFCLFFSSFINKSHLSSNQTRRIRIIRYPDNFQKYPNIC